MKTSTLPAAILALVLAALPLAALAGPHGPPLAMRGPSLGPSMEACPGFRCLSPGPPHIATFALHGPAYPAPHLPATARWQRPQALARWQHYPPIGRQALRLPPGSAATNLQAGARKPLYAPPGKRVLHDRALAGLSPRDPAAAKLATATFRGRLAEWHDHGDHDGDHHDGDHHDHCGWRCGYVIGWFGWVWWPYAYWDLWDYTLWRYSDDTFWPYAYDDLYWGIYGGYAPYPYGYAPDGYDGYASAAAATRQYPAGQRVARTSPGVPPATPGDICTGRESGLTDWPIERIAAQVQPNEVERALLDKLKDATAHAVTLLQSACPTDLLSTPTGRLAAVRQRIDAMLQAVRIIEPALGDFYHSLSDEQKELFNALDNRTPATAGAERSQQQQPDPAQLCSSPTAMIPTDRIDQALRLDPAQRDALAGLNRASAEAADLISRSCPQDTALTPPGRVAAMEQRLNAMLQAIDIVQPALTGFYNSLSDEQKARFNRLPRAA
jgi:hypothetical protein